MNQTHRNEGGLDTNLHVAYSHKSEMNAGRTPRSRGRNKGRDSLLHAQFGQAVKRQSRTITPFKNQTETWIDGKLIDSPILRNFSSPSSNFISALPRETISEKKSSI